MIYEKLAQLAEHLPFKERVEGSNPSFLIQTGITFVIPVLFFHGVFSASAHR